MLMGNVIIFVNPKHDTQSSLSNLFFEMQRELFLRQNTSKKVTYQPNMRHITFLYKVELSNELIK